MPWPWVSREAYDERGRELERLTEMLGSAIDRNVDLTAQLLRAERLTLVPANMTAANLSSRNGTNGNGNIRKSSVVAEAIRAEAAGDVRLAGYFWKRASELKADGRTPEEIAEQITSWQTTETEGVPEGER